MHQHEHTQRSVPNWPWLGWVAAMSRRQVCPRLYRRPPLADHLPAACKARPTPQCQGSVAPGRRARITGGASLEFTWSVLVTSRCTSSPLTRDSAVPATCRSPASDKDESPDEHQLLDRYLEGDSNSTSSNMSSYPAWILPASQRCERLPLGEGLEHLVPSGVEHRDQRTSKKPRGPNHQNAHGPHASRAVCLSS